MRVRRFLLAVVTAAAAAPAARAQTQDDFATVAEGLAPQIRERIAAKLGAGTGRVAVFPFGDADGKITTALYEPNMVLQGELIVNLMRQAKGRFLVLDKPALQQEVRAARVDLSGVRAGDARGTAAALRRMNVDAAVLGSIDAVSAAQVARDRLTKVNVALTIVYRDGTADQLTGAAGARHVPSPHTIASGRFRVQLLLTGRGSPVEVPLVTSRNPVSDYHNVCFAEVPDDLRFGTEAAAYALRVSNRGTPPVYPHNPADRDRVFGVTVSVDGVNTLYQNKGDGTVGPVVVHPRNARKWLLTGPGRRIVADPLRPFGFRLDPAAGDGQSVLDVRGFQTGPTTAEKFVFTSPGDSIAETVGITHDVGVITIHIYPENLPQDAKTDPPATPVTPLDPTPTPPPVPGATTPKSTTPPVPGSTTPKATVAPVPGSTIPKTSAPAVPGSALPMTTAPAPAGKADGPVGPTRGPDVPPADLGTKAGPAVANPVYTISPDLRQSPVEVWRIFYRKKRDCPIPVADRVAIGPTPTRGSEVP